MPDETLARIRAENLGVYRASRVRLKEDVSQEDEIAANYQGRLLYELLQNADDAMAGAATLSDRIVFRLTDSDLWVGNSGRPLSDADVGGLCGVGASKKSDVDGPRRASIGHKGMGFKSTLEITSEPQAISEAHSFQLGAKLAHGDVAALFRELGESPPLKVPAMRFPYDVDDRPDYWHQLRGAGIRTLFRFPLRPDLSDDVLSELAQRLLDFPVTSIVFLKHLERVDVTVERGDETRSRGWGLTRERRVGDAWELSSGLEETGLYRIEVVSDDDRASFLLAHDADVAIGAHRGGLGSRAWEGIELSEVSVAACTAGDRPTPAPAEWRKLHVFLPTGETSPYPFLVNGAFASDLSRRDIHVSSDADDYNRYLLRCAARVFRDRLVPGLEEAGASITEILSLLDRGGDPGAIADREASQALYESMREELGTHAFLPSGEPGERLRLGDCVVPPLVEDTTLGAELRDLLDPPPPVNGQRLPSRELCNAPFARTLADHGARALQPAEVPPLIAQADLDRLELQEHPSGGVSVDPVLVILERFWETLDYWDRREFAAAVRREPLFPVEEEDGVIQRVATEGRECFYPPRALKGNVPLRNLSFLMQELCWGALSPAERNALLREQLNAWQGLFEVREFKFPDVMRASVLPALTLDVSSDNLLRRSLFELDSVAAICQLSGRTPNPEAPLPYERLGPNRQLFNLARLPVPCRGTDGKIEWHPAYTVYLGEDWIGRESLERVLQAIDTAGGQAPEVPLLAPPAELVGRLARFSHLTSDEGEAAGDLDEDDEVDIEEDEERPLDSDEHERWLRFLTWIGVNRGLRPVPFNDVEDRAGWLQTGGLQRPAGRAFRNVSDELWTRYRGRVSPVATEHASSPADSAYFYRLHNLDYVGGLLDAAASDPTNAVGRALFEHLALNWPRLQRFTRCQLAVVPYDRAPSRRNKPIRAYDDELFDAGDDFWIWRLRSRDFCPTSHGPRKPRRTWLRSGEVERRFGRRGSDPAQLLPLLALSPDLEPRAADALALALGVRPELTADAFEPEDTRLLLDRLRVVWEGISSGDRDRALRQVVRPAYRNLVELLPGADDPSRAGYSEGALTGAPLLVHNSTGDFQFEASDRVLWAERSGTQDRLGRPPDLWTFVLEALPAARAPLTRLLGVRVLEEQLVWQAEPGEPALDDEHLQSFRTGLESVAPYLLARLGADRADERLASRDAQRLKGFVSDVEPVTELAVRCELDGRDMGVGTSRAAFGVPPRRDQPLQAFVVWGESPWPPDAAEAEGLAQALCDCLEVTAFEAFLALLTAGSQGSRRRILELAGAPTDLAATRDAFHGVPTEGSSGEKEAGDPVAVPNTAGETTGEETSATDEEVGTEPTGPVTKTPLYAPGQLEVFGVPVEVLGSKRGTSHRGNSNGRAKAGASTGGAYGGHTDLSELDRVGMDVVLSFERERLRRAGVQEAAIYEEGSDDVGALIFDVSTLAAVDAARKACSRFTDALAFLRQRGVNPQAPGFDVLTLKPEGSDEPVDRLIELKSSGVRARTQEMSWNEWKSAGASELRRFFYLYLVGNLRRDLTGALPFIRTVRDPFGALGAIELEEHSLTRKVRLALDGFEVAEELELRVREGQAKAAKTPSDEQAWSMEIGE